MQRRARCQPVAGLQAARERARMLDAARRFFADHDVLEVDTPVLSRSAVSDPNIESVRVALQADPSRDYFLQTSPEYAMKRLLCAGWPDMYQVSRVFRDGEVGRRHQPEFTLIEWYRRNLSLAEMIAHTVDFISTLIVPGALHATERVSYIDAFRRHAGVHPLDADVSSLMDACSADASLRSSLGGDRNRWLDLLLGDRIAPRFPHDRLTVLHHYPASQAALARRCPDDPRCADRFEVFCGDLELANGYYEVSDALELRKRFADDQEQRRRCGQTLRPLDDSLLDALERGMPPCCGVAVGLERVLMINCNTRDIRDVLTFDFRDQENPGP